MESTLNPIPTPVMKPFDSSPATPKLKNMPLALISIAVVLAGIGTGYLLSGVGSKSSGSTNLTSGLMVSENEAGVTDNASFPDTAEGILEEGGISGEGTHHLVRGSGPSQYAYLTSSVVDLAPFVGKKVQVWGQTFTGKKAGFFMDIGKIKVVEGE